MTKKKREWGIIVTPLASFAILIAVPWIPTIQIIICGYHKIWLILTFGWAISWYTGLAIWSEEYEKRKGK